MKYMIPMPLHQTFIDGNIQPTKVLTVMDEGMQAGPTWRQVMYANITADSAGNHMSGITGRDLLLMTCVRLSQEQVSAEIKDQLKAIAKTLDEIWGEDSCNNALVPKMSYFDDKLKEYQTAET